MSDAELVAHAREHPPGAQTAKLCVALVFERRRALVRAVCAAKAPVDVVDDLESQVYLRFVRAVYTQTAPMQNPSGLLVKMARNVIATHFEKRRGEAVPYGEMPETGALDDGYGEAETSEYVEQLLSNLSPAQRDGRVGAGDGGPLQRRDRRPAREDRRQRRRDLLPRARQAARGGGAMSAVEERFDAFAAAWERGEHPDPAAAIAGAPEEERAALGGMIAAYLSANPRTDVPDDVVAARAADPASEPPVAWPELLPALRERARITRSALVERLAAALGFPDATEQVEEHVHGLETGGLPAGRVRPAVVAALASILDVPESLLEAGRRLGSPGVEPAAMAAFSRAERARAAPAPTEELREVPARNAEIDDLFTGSDG